MKSTEFGSIAEVIESREFKEFLNRNTKKENSFLNNITKEGIPGKRITLIAGKSNFKGHLESFLNEISKEKEKKKNLCGEDVFLLTGKNIETLAKGEPICVNGQWIAISEKSELKLVESIEKKWVDECGLSEE